MPISYPLPMSPFGMDAPNAFAKIVARGYDDSTGMVTATVNVYFNKAACNQNNGLPLISKIYTGRVGDPGVPDPDNLPNGVKLIDALYTWLLTMPDFAGGSITGA